jgi:hypothetical protein
MDLWISPLVLWLVFAASLPGLAIERHQKLTCWLSGFICAIAIMTTAFVAQARF